MARMVGQKDLIGKSSVKLRIDIQGCRRYNKIYKIIVSYFTLLLDLAKEPMTKSHASFCFFFFLYTNASRKEIHSYGGVLKLTD